MDWIEMFCFLIANTLMIFGINKATFFEYCHPDEDKQFCTEDGIDKDSMMVGYKFRKYSLDKFGQFLSKPLFTCPPCMASVWGTIFFAFTGLEIIYWPLYILMLSGLVTLVNYKIYGGS